MWKTVKHYKDIPKNTCGVYCWLHKGDIIYVGASTNMRQRHSSHDLRHEFHAWAEFIRYYEFSLDDTLSMEALEAVMIERFKPRLNQQRVRNLGNQSFAKAVELAENKQRRIAERAERRKELLQSFAEHLRQRKEQSPSKL